MVPKSVKRFSDEIMRKQARSRKVWSGFSDKIGFGAKEERAARYPIVLRGS
jgi:hypothetical protein